jgi:hypothetical protein
MVARIAPTLALVLAALAAGCGGGGSSASGANSQFCTDLNDLAVSIIALQGIDLGSASQDQLDAAAHRVERQWSQVKQSATALKDSSLDALKQAGDDLAASVALLTDVDEMAEGTVSISGRLTTFAGAFAKAADDKNCND